MTVKLLVVEDHAVVRLGLQMLLDNQPDVDIVGEALTGAQALQLADALRPDVVLMDLGLPDSSGIDISAEIKRRHPDTAIVALTIHEDREYIDRMLSIGALGYISKRAAPEELIAAIHKAAEGQTYLGAVLPG
ncbi:MAG: response regulator [Anaerolineales bacterium]|nr:response regulator [Anaerolineales bacterium]